MKTRELRRPNGQSDRKISRRTGMRVKVVQFIAIITTALYLVPTGALP